MMTKDEREYYNKYYNKLNLSYMKTYNIFIRRLPYIILNNRDLVEIKLDILEMFYRNQCIGKSVEEVIGDDREKFFKDIINSYCGNAGKINLIKGILRVALSISLIYIIFGLFLENNSILIVCSIPLGIFTSVCSYLVNAYIKSDLISGALNGVIGMSVPMACYKLSQFKDNAYTFPTYIIILVIISLSIIIFYLFKKKK